MTVQELIDQLREAQASMTDEQRMELWEKIMDGYCQYCGQDVLPCFCHPSYDE